MGRGRGKVTIKRIQNEKTRKSVFIQRNEGLTKKVSKFSEKFGAEACLIVYDGDDSDARPMTWPQDLTVVQSMLKKYEVQKIQTAPKKFDVKDYFANRKSTVEGEISRVHKKMVMNKYPTWSRCFNNMEMEHLKDFINIVDLKIQACNQRINMLKNMQQNDQIGLVQNTAKMQSVAQENVSSPQSSQLDDPIKPLIDISEMIDFTDQIEWDNLMAEHREWDAQHVEFNDWANKKTGEMQSVAPNDVIVSPQSMKPVIDISEMIDFTNDVEWDDQITEHEEWDTQLVEFNDWGNQLDVSCLASF